MDNEKEHFDITHYQPNEEEKEKASTSYLMSLIAIIIGLPMPIINLAATALFYFLSRRGTYYVRWHSMQALISQVPLFVLNNILFWWTIRILFCINDLSSLYIAYFIVVNLYNVYDFIETTTSAVHTRKGLHHGWFLYSDLTQMVMQHRVIYPLRSLTHGVALVAGFFVMLLAFNQVDWMNCLSLRPTIVSDKLSQWTWQLSSATMSVDDNSPENARLDSVLYTLCQPCGIDTSTVHIHYSRSMEVNAFSTVGNNIVVNKGLLNDIKNDDELYGVLAHELAHTQLGHVRHLLGVHLVVTTAFVFLSGGGDGNIITQLAEQLITNTFDRDKEAEADRQAVQYMIQTHHDPLALATFLRRMDTFVPEFLSDHPDSEKRAKVIEQMVKKEKKQKKE